MDFVKRHSFESFGWYRIILSIVILAYFFITK
jgi:undecaprenyl-diphosphatase